MAPGATAIMTKVRDIAPPPLLALCPWEPPSRCSRRCNRAGAPRRCACRRRRCPAADGGALPASFASAQAAISL